jgi:hypothetical protein
MVRRRIASRIKAMTGFGLRQCIRPVVEARGASGHNGLRAPIVLAKLDGLKGHHSGQVSMGAVLDRFRHQLFPPANLKHNSVAVVLRESGNRGFCNFHLFLSSLHASAR